MSHAVYEDMLMKITSLLFAAALAAQANAASSLPLTPELPYDGPLRLSAPSPPPAPLPLTTWLLPSRIRPTAVGR